MIVLEKTKKGMYMALLPSLTDGEIISVFASPPLISTKRECVIRTYKVVQTSNGIILDYIYPNDRRNITRRIRLDGEDSKILCWASRIEFASTKKGILLIKVEGKRHKVLPKIGKHQVVYKLNFLQRAKIYFQNLIPGGIPQVIFFIQKSPSPDLLFLRQLESCFYYSCYVSQTPQSSRCSAHHPDKTRGTS